MKKKTYDGLTNSNNKNTRDRYTTQTINLELRSN